MLFRKQVLGTREDAEKDGVKVPLTLQEYCVSVAPKTSEPSQDIDFYDDDYDDGMDDDEDDDEEDFYVEDDDDSGNEESWLRISPLFHSSSSSSVSPLKRHSKLLWMTFWFFSSIFLRK